MQKLQLGMTAPTDLDMEDRALAGEEMFDLGEGERELSRAGGRDIGDVVRDADGMSESEDEASAELVPEEDDDVLSSDEEREMRLAELEGEIDGHYDEYKDRMAERDAKWRVKQERLRDRNYDSWHGIKEGEESDDGVDKGYRDGMVRVPRRGDADEEEEESEGEGGWDIVAAQKAKLGEEADSDDSESEDEDTEVKPKKKAKITIRPDARAPAEPSRLLTTLSTADKRAEMSRQAQVWFDQGVFKDVGDLAALDGEDESEEEEEDEDMEEEESEDDEDDEDEDEDVEMASSVSSTLEGEAEDDDDFEIVPQEVDDEPEWDVDDEDQDETLQKKIKG